MCNHVVGKFITLFNQLGLQHWYLMEAYLHNDKSLCRSPSQGYSRFQGGIHQHKVDGCYRIRGDKLGKNETENNSNRRSQQHHACKRGSLILASQIIWFGVKYMILEYC